MIITKITDNDNNTDRPALGLLLSTQAPVKIPNSVDFLFFSSYRFSCLLTGSLVFLQVFQP